MYFLVRNDPLILVSMHKSSIILYFPFLEKRVSILFSKNSLRNSVHSELILGYNSVELNMKLFILAFLDGTGKLVGDADQGASDIKKETQKSSELKGILSSGKSRTIKKKKGNILNSSFCFYKTRLEIDQSKGL